MNDFEFLPIDTSEIESLVIAAYENVTGVTVMPAAPEMLFAKWVTYMIMQERIIANYIGNQNIPSRASGENLDALAELFYIEKRPQAKSAYTKERFYISQPQNVTILIPKGTRVTDVSKNLYWETIEESFVRPGETYTDTQVVCQTPGAIGNGYTAGQINTIVDVYDYYTKCENIEETAGGTDAATDEEFYNLMRLSLGAYSTAGASAAYEYFAKSVSNDIADVRVQRGQITYNKTVDVFRTDTKNLCFIGGNDIDIDSVSIPDATIDVDYLLNYENNLLIIEIINESIISDETISVSYYENNPGIVNIIPLMENGNLTPQAIKEKILETCSEETVRPLTDKVNVIDPVLIDFDIDFTYYWSTNSSVSYEEIEQNIANAVNEYVQWQCSKIGRDINPSKLHALLMGTGVKRVVIRSPVYTVIDQGENQLSTGVARFVNYSAIPGGAEDE